MAYPAVILACAQKVPPGWNSTQTEVRKIKEALMAITCTIYCASTQGSSDGKPDDPEYREPIDFEVHREKIEQFKQDFIYSRMRSIESQSGLYVAVLNLFRMQLTAE